MESYLTSIQFVMDNWIDEVCTHAGVAFMVVSLCHDSDPYWKWNRFWVFAIGLGLFLEGAYIGLTN